MYEALEHWKDYQSKKLQKNKNTYRVEGIFWDPMYRDFDIDSYEIKAYSKAQAKKKAQMHWKYDMAKKPPAITKLANTNTINIKS